MYGMEVLKLVGRKKVKRLKRLNKFADKREEINPNVNRGA
jgi:hypothetical protein